MRFCGGKEDGREQRSAFLQGDYTFVLLFAKINNWYLWEKPLQMNVLVGDIAG